MQVSISEAARLAGVRRNTIYRKLESGRLAKQTTDDGNPVIEMSELARVYPHVVSCPGQRPPKQQETVPNTRNGAGGQAELTLLRELVDVLKKDNAKLTDALERSEADRRNERDEAREERLRYIDMLEKANLQIAATREPSQQPPAHKRGFWARIAGRA